MHKVSLFSTHICTILGLFSTSIIVTISTDASSVAVPARTIAQRTTDPSGIPTPTPIPIPIPKPLAPPTTTTPSPTESPIPIFVPPPKTPIPGGIKPTTPTPQPTPTATPPQFPTSHTNRVLSPSERDKISAYLRTRNLTSNAIGTGSIDPRFILHDTSVIMSPSQLERERQLGRGPLGLGVNAYLPQGNAAVLARPNFYELRRPTTTEFEKASDILDLQDREKLLRQVWRATNGDARRQALDTALANQGLSAIEIAKEQKDASTKLAGSGRIFTAGTWTIEAVCNRYNSGDKSILNPNQEDSLRSACGTLTNYFNIRNTRIKSSVAAEIIQVGTRSDRGNQNTCSASNSNIATLPNPPYSDNQYNFTLALYLRAAVTAGKFPQITTHFALDTFDPEAHCDPRCFNLTKLYNSIASVMGHAQGSTYGIIPSYGMRGGTNNIWWNDRICHGSAP
jgi:hypothetical protein